MVCFGRQFRGKPKSVACEYRCLEVRQTHSSEEAYEQNANEKRHGGAGGAKGSDREKVIHQE